MIVVVFGVSGAGKTTVGKLLAEELGWKFYEADDFHPKSNVEKMRHGIPLDDDDRRPWLAKLREQIQCSLGSGENAILACSALKAAYRRVLHVSAKVRFVFLSGDERLVAEQLSKRKGHFLGPALLKSQFADLEGPEPDEDVITVSLGPPPNELAAEIRNRLRLGET